MTSINEVSSNMSQKIEQQTNVVNTAQSTANKTENIFSQCGIDMENASQNLDICNINLQKAEQSISKADEKVENCASALDRTACNISELEDLIHNTKDSNQKDKLSERLKHFISQADNQKKELETALKNQQVSKEAKEKAINAYDHANVVLAEVGANYTKASANNDSAFKYFSAETEKLRNMQTEADKISREKGLDMLSKEYGTDVGEILNQATGGYDLGKSAQEDEKFFAALKDHINKNGGINAAEKYADTTEYDNSKRPTDEENKTSCAVGIASMLDNDPRCVNLTLGEKVALVVCSQEDMVKNTQEGNLDSYGIGKKDLDKAWTFVNDYESQKAGLTLEEKKTQVKQFDDIFREVKNKQGSVDDSEVITKDTVNEVYNKLSQIQKENESSIIETRKNKDGSKTEKYSDGTSITYKKGASVTVSKYLEDSYQYSAGINTNENKDGQQDMLLSSVHKITSSKMTDSTTAFQYGDSISKTDINTLTSDTEITSINGKAKIRSNIFSKNKVKNY